MIALVRNALAQTYDARSAKRTWAPPSAQASLDIRRKLLGDDHPDTIDSISLVGPADSLQGQILGSRELYLDAITRSRRVLGADSPYAAA